MVFCTSDSYLILLKKYLVPFTVPFHGKWHYLLHLSPGNESHKQGRIKEIVSPCATRGST